ncbi:MAG: 2-hydroxyacid dehydrogenase [Clostridiales bacterium]|nr:2-hydroxyacid dehydrogenase [Clostridiales bacterium]
MKLVGVSDLFIPKEHIVSGFKGFEDHGVNVEVLDWQLKDFEELQNINFLVEQGGSEAYEPPEYILEACRDADIFITQFCTVTKKLIDACPRLKVIGVLRAGYENINFEYATEKGIMVFNTPGRNADSVADFTMGVLLSECRNIARGHFGLKNGQWVRIYPNSGQIPDLPGKTVGIVGLGEIGLKVAKRLVGFDVNLLGYDPFVDNPPYGIKMVSLPQLMEESDFVTLHVRAVKETENLINRELIEKMKPTAYFINTSRSSVADEGALYDALKNNRIAGAALDVFDKEPPGKEYPLVRLENVTLTPHMAGGSNDAFHNSPAKLAREMIGLWAGKSSRYLVNKDLFPEGIQNFVQSKI